MASSKTAAEYEHEIAALKTAVKREMGLRKYVEANFEESMQFLVYSWAVMLTKSNLKPVKIAKFIFQYVDATTHVYWSGNSEPLGIKTSIRDYRCKDGRVIQAHFTANDRFYKRICDAGPEPVFYDGKFKVTREQFEVNFDYLTQVANGEMPAVVGMVFKPKAVE